MWTEIERYLPRFESAVLNVRDGDGYPYSIRCRPEQDRQAGILRLDLAEGTIVGLGPASLLCHSHDEGLWNQKIFLLRGRVEAEEKGYAFRPEKFIPSIGTGGIRGTLSLMTGARKATAAYLRKRGLDRPGIPWTEVAAVKKEV